jgi:hypothetical protein
VNPPRVEMQTSFSLQDDCATLMTKLNQLVKKENDVAPSTKLRIEYVLISQLKKNPHNARSHNPGQIASPDRRLLSLLQSTGVPASRHFISDLTRLPRSPPKMLKEKGQNGPSVTELVPRYL